MNTLALLSRADGSLGDRLPIFAVLPFVALLLCVAVLPLMAHQWWDKNRNKAMAVLRARLYDIELRRRQSEASEERRSQVGTGDRSEKVRTYNFPQDRVTDHRIKLTVSNLPGVLNGDLDTLIASLQLADHTARLADAMGEPANGFAANGRDDE